MTTPVTTGTTPTSFALPKAAASARPPSTAVAVYRPQASKIAERMRELDLVVTAPLDKLVHTKKDAKVLTDNWGWPLVGGVVAAIGSVFFVEGALIPLALAGSGAVTSTVAGIAHRFVKRRAIENAPPLLEGDLRDEVMKLADARADFEPGEGKRLEANELDAFVARRAQALLATAKHDYYGTNDADLIALLERYASISTKLTPDEEALLDFVDNCLQAAKHGHKSDAIPKLFAALSDSQQRELAPFVRDLVLDGDRPKLHVDLKPFLGLHETLEALEPKAVVPFATTPSTTPAKVARGTDAVAALESLAKYVELASAIQELSWGSRDAGPELLKRAAEFAIADERTGVERYMMGVMAHRAIAHLDRQHIYAFTLRLALKNLAATADAEPPAVQNEAKLILRRAENIMRGLAEDLSYAHKLQCVVDIVALSRA